MVLNRSHHKETQVTQSCVGGCERYASLNISVYTIHKSVDAESGIGEAISDKPKRCHKLPQAFPKSVKITDLTHLNALATDSYSAITHEFGLTTPKQKNDAEVRQRSQGNCVVKFISNERWVQLTEEVAECRSGYIERNTVVIQFGCGSKQLPVSNENSIDILKLLSCSL